MRYLLVSSRLAIAGIVCLAAVGLGSVDPALAAEISSEEPSQQTMLVDSQQTEAQPVDPRQLLRMMQQIAQQLQQMNPVPTQQLPPPLQQLLQADPDQTDPQQIVRLLQQLDPQM